LNVNSSNGMPGEGTLPIALTKEVGEDDGAQERVLEGEGAKDDTDEDKNLGEGDNGHGPVVVG
jgi:hypothetical protein